MNIDSIQEQRAKISSGMQPVTIISFQIMLPMKKMESQASTSIALLVPSIVTTTMLPSMYASAPWTSAEPISFADWSGLDWNAVLMNML